MLELSHFVSDSLPLLCRERLNSFTSGQKQITDSDTSPNQHVEHTAFASLLLCASPCFLGLGFGWRCIVCGSSTNNLWVCLGFGICCCFAGSLLWRRSICNRILAGCLGFGVCFCLAGSLLWRRSICNRILGGCLGFGACFCLAGSLLGRRRVCSRILRGPLAPTLRLLSGWTLDSG